MAKSQTQAKETQAEKLRKPAPPTLAPETHPDLPELPFDPSLLFDGGTLESQVSLLQRLPHTNQQAAIQHIQRVQSSQHVQRLVTALRTPSDSSGEAPLQHATASALVTPTPSVLNPPQGKPAKGGPSVLLRARPVVQTKLDMSEPGDAHEVEAEQTADMIMKMPAPATPPPPPDEQPNNPPGKVQRAVQGNGGSGIDPQVEDRVRSLKGRGKPLPEDEREFFESRFGADFSGVRIHTDSTAVETSKDLNARAYTVGSDIAFNSGEYQPGTGAGRHLLAHELTHVIQQGGAGTLERSPEEEEMATIARSAAPDRVQRAPAGLAPAGTGSQAGAAFEEFILSSASDMGQNYDGLGVQINDGFKADTAAIAVEAEPLPIEMEGLPVPPEKIAGEVTETPGPGITQDVTGPDAAPLEAKPHRNAGGAPDNASSINKLEGGGGLFGFLSSLFNKFKDALTGIRTKDTGVKTKAEDKPQLEAVGTADPARAERQAEEGQSQVQERQALVAQELQAAPGEELVQPLELQEEAPVVLKAAEPQTVATVATDDMRAYVAMEVPAEVRQGADEVLKPMLAVSLAEPQAAVGQALQERDSAKAEALAEAQEAVAAEQLAADAVQQAEVERFRTEIAEEKQRNIEESEALRAEFEAELETEQQAISIEVEQRLTEDQQQADQLIAESELEAEAEKARAEAQAQEKKAEAERESQDESWWSRAASAVKSAIKAVSEVVDTIFTTLRETVKGIIEAAKNAAIAVIEAGRQWVVAKLDTFRSWVQSKIDTFLGERFPALAKALNAFVDFAVDQAIAKVNEIADELKATVTRWADKLAETLDSVIGAFQSVVQAQLALISALAEGDFAAAARIIFETALKTLGLSVDQIMGILNKAGDAVKRIFSDPIGFLGDLIGGVKMGLNNFIANILTHLQQGFIAWLTGSLSEIAITLPEKFDLMGIFNLAMQVMGISMDQIKARVTELLGFDIFGLIDRIKEIWEIYKESGLVGLARYGLAATIGAENAEALFDLIEGVQAILSGDWAKVWELVKSHLGMLKEMVIDKIKEFLVEKVIKAGITWILSLCNPAGAIVRAVKGIYDIVMFFVERGKQIMALVNAVTDSIGAIASGAIGVAANAVEGALAKGIPVAISFLSSLLGLTGIASKVKEVIEKVRGTVDKALTAVFNSGPVQAVAGFIRGIADKIRGGLNKIKNFLFPQKQFAIASESHTLSLKGEEGRPVLYMASTPRPLIERLDEANGKPDLDAGAKSEIPLAKTLLGEIESLGEQANKEPDPVKQEGFKTQIDAKYGALVPKLVKILGVPELTGQAKIKYDQVMADAHIPAAVRERFDTQVKGKLISEGIGGDRMPVLIGVVTSGDYLAKGPDIPAKELKDKGGMTRVIPLRTIWNDNLAADYKAKYRSFEAWLGALVKNRSAFNPGTHLNKGSTIPGQYATAWWAPRGAQKGNTMAELITELALNPGSYDGGCIRATIGPDAAKMAGFKKPTALDGIFFAEFVLAPSNPWGVTGGGSLEAVAPKIALSQTTQLEFLPGDMSKAEDYSQVIKDRAIELVTAKQPFKTVKALQDTIAEVESLLKPEGLKSLEAKPTAEPGIYDIIAIASPSDTGRVVIDRPAALKGLLTPNLDKLEEIEPGVSERYVGDHERTYEGRQPLLKYVEGRAARKMGKRTEPGSLAAYCKASGMSISKNNKAIEILNSKGETLRERVPDFFAEGSVVGDIKNVKTLSYDEQMRDDVRISKGDDVKLRGSSAVLGATNRFDLAVRVPGEDGKMGTHVSAPLKAAVTANGGTIYEVIE